MNVHAPNPAANVYFDCETTSATVSPVSIICAVTAQDASVSQWVEDPPCRITTETARALAVYILQAGPVVTWNGCAFDMKLLAEHVEDAEIATQLAEKTCYDHFDLMFDFWCSNGYRASLNGFLIGSNLPQKIMSGEDASELWKTDIAKVLEYCAGDVDALRLLVELAAREKVLKRVTIKGSVQPWVPYKPGEFRTPSECIESYTIMPPDVSWMDSPPDPLLALQWAAVLLQSAQ